MALALWIQSFPQVRPGRALREGDDSQEQIDNKQAGNNRPEEDASQATEVKQSNKQQGNADLAEGSAHGGEGCSEPG